MSDWLCWILHRLKLKTCSSHVFQKAIHKGIVERAKVRDVKKNTTLENDIQIIDCCRQQIVNRRKELGERILSILLRAFFLVHSISLITSFVCFILHRLFLLLSLSLSQSFVDWRRNPNYFVTPIS